MGERLATGTRENHTKTRSQEIANYFHPSPGAQNRSKSDVRFPPGILQDGVRKDSTETPTMKHTTHLKLLLTLVLPSAALLTSTQAAPGDLDPTFGEGGKTAAGFPLAGPNIGNAVALQTDGKIVLAGYFGTATNGTSDMALLRFNPDGSIDSSFGTSGLVTTDFGGADRAYAVLVQPDGKIIAAGSSDTFFALARYHSDGTPDTSFGEFGDGLVRTNVSGGGAAQINGIARQSDGKIVVAGRRRRRD